jgi:hypothetical protein
MSTKIKTIIRHILAVLNFPAKISYFLLYAKSIYKAMNGNPLFTSVSTQVTALNTDITLLDTLETAAKSRTVGTVDARNAQVEVVKNDLRLMRNLVQALADATPAKAEQIITSAGMTVKKTGQHGRHTNLAVNYTEPGTVLLTGEGTGPHEWRMSTDEINWTPLPASRSSKTIVSGLTPNTKYYFQNRQILTKGLKSEWSPVFSIRVN